MDSISLYSNLLENVFRQTNAFVTHVALARFIPEFIKTYATDPQHEWFLMQFVHIEDEARRYFNLGLILREYEYGDLQAIAEAQAEAFGEVSDDIKEAFETVISTQGRGPGYVRLLMEPSPGISR